MVTPSSQQQSHLSSGLFFQRYLIISIFIGIFVIALLARLFFITILHNQHYATESRKNFLNTMAVAPSRGLIFDRNGIIIAANKPAYRLNLIPGKIDDLDQTLKGLQKIAPISDQDIEQFKQHRYQYHAFDLIPIGNTLNERQRAVFYVNAFAFPGVSIQSSQTRYYPHGKATSAVVGYVGKINQATPLSDNYTNTRYIGESGIEKSEEMQLHGETGVNQAEINARGQIIRTLKTEPSKAGKNITLTIDSQLQQYIVSVMGDASGAVVAIDPNNGEILAMVSTPSYDTNLFSQGMSTAEYQELINNPHHPLYNKATKGLYSPGSTIKPFFAISALDNDIIEPSSKIYDPGWFTLPNTKHQYHDWMWFVRKQGHGWVNLTQALTVSCDTYFYWLANKMGISLMDHTLDMFGFGQPTGTEMPYEAKGVIPSPTWKLANQQSPWYDGDTVITGIGQGSLLVTPLQLASATATLAMKGKHKTPHLIKTINNSKHKSPQENRDIVLRNPNNWDVITNALEKVVADPQGTAEYFGHTNYTVAAKTGTAQVYGHHRDEEYSQQNRPWKLRNNHLFISYAPTDHPQIALAIVIEHDGGADRIARKVIDYYFQHQSTSSNSSG